MRDTCRSARLTHASLHRSVDTVSWHRARRATFLGRFRCHNTFFVTRPTMITCSWARVSWRNSMVTIEIKDETVDEISDRMPPIGVSAAKSKSSSDLELPGSLTSSTSISFYGSDNSQPIRNWWGLRWSFTVVNHSMDGCCTAITIIINYFAREFNTSITSRVFYVACTVYHTISPDKQFSDTHFSVRDHIRVHSPLGMRFVKPRKSPYA